jgi:hypothetical protein
MKGIPLCDTFQGGLADFPIPDFLIAKRESPEGLGQELRLGLGMAVR